MSHNNYHQHKPRSRARVVQNDESLLILAHSLVGQYLTFETLTGHAYTGELTNVRQETNQNNAEFIIANCTITSPHTHLPASSAPVQQPTQLVSSKSHHTRPKTLKQTLAMGNNKPSQQQQQPQHQQQQKLAANNKQTATTPFPPVALRARELKYFYVSTPPPMTQNEQQGDKIILNPHFNPLQQIGGFIHKLDREQRHYTKGKGLRRADAEAQKMEQLQRILNEGLDSNNNNHNNHENKNNDSNSHLNDPLSHAPNPNKRPIKPAEGYEGQNNVNVVRPYQQFWATRGGGCFVRSSHTRHKSVALTICASIVMMESS